MIDEKRIDESIAHLVRAVQQDVPFPVEEEILRRSAALRHRKRHPLSYRLLWTLIPSGAALILGALFLMRPPLKPTNSDISEIRTQFEIADKNITIVFYQKMSYHNTRED